MLYRLLDLLRYQRDKIIYRAIIISAAVCGSEVRALSKICGNTLPIRERKILRKLYGPVKENNVWRIRTNQKLVYLYTELDIISEFRKITRVRTCGKSARRKKCEESV